MGRRLNSFIIKYTWLLPLLVMVMAVFYYINWFERLYAEDRASFHMDIFVELQISISVLLATTALLNWALVGFWKHLCTGQYKTTLKVMRKDARK